MKNKAFMQRKIHQMLVASLVLINGEKRKKLKGGEREDK